MPNKPIKLYRLAINDGDSVTYKRGSLVAIARQLLAMSAAGELKPTSHFYVSPITNPLPFELKAHQ